MDEAEGGEAAPTFRFKKRKITHVQRARILDDDAEAQSPMSADDVQSPITPPAQDDEDTGLKLKEILRKRKRPQDRAREAARKAAERKAEAPMQLEPPKPDQYSGRFIAQTGLVVAKDDEQMAIYVEARLAEKNHRQHGWPIPKHLTSAVAALPPSTDRDVSGSPPVQKATTDTAMEKAPTAKPGHDNRMAAGMGKLQEIDLGPEASARNIQRTEEARKRLAGIREEAAVDNVANSSARPQGNKRRRQQRRTSEDLRRDMLVEAVLREAKLDYFEEDAPPSPTAGDAEDADEAFYEQFRREYESTESRNQRKPAPPPAGPKGVKEQPKGPKLGGSRSARAAMRLQEEQAAKTKR